VPRLAPLPVVQEGVAGAAQRLPEVGPIVAVAHPAGVTILQIGKAIY